MPESGPPGSKIGPTQGIAGGPPSTKVAGGTAPPGGGHSPITPTTGSKSASTRAVAPTGKKVGEISTEGQEARITTEEEEEQQEKRISPEEEQGMWARSE